MRVPEEMACRDSSFLPEYPSQPIHLSFHEKLGRSFQVPRCFRFWAKGFKDALAADQLENLAPFFGLGADIVIRVFTIDKANGPESVIISNLPKLITLRS